MTARAPLDAGGIVDLIADIFNRRGADSYLGEQVTMSEHMLQAAHHARQAGADDELVAAALLHDIGHYGDEFPDDALERGIDNHHDVVGAALLEPWFPPRVVAGVRWHVQAKRYLCAVEPDYFATLSDASVHSLALQGGPMTAAEAESFARRDDLDAIVRVRRYDEDAKEPGVVVAPFEDYVPLLRRLVGTRRGQN